MLGDDHLYLDIKTLRSRGWTDTLISRYLGKPDRWATVEHYRDFRGKRTYFLGRIEQVEASVEFGQDFEKSISRRKLKKKTVREFMEARQITENDVSEWRKSLTDEDIRTAKLLGQVTEIFEGLRRDGLRTPHKA